MALGGRVSFGHVAFFGGGAYAAAWVHPVWGLGLFAALLVASGASALLAALSGALLVRSSGVYLAMLSLALAQVLWATAGQWVALGGGDNGLIGLQLARCSLRCLFRVCLQVGQGELVVLEGLNGAGKSTLLQSIIGLGPRVQGGVVFQGRQIALRSAHERARLGLGFVPEGRRLFADLTVQENLLVAARLPAPQTPGQKRLSTAQQLAQVLALFPALQPMRKHRALEVSGEW